MGPLDGIRILEFGGIGPGPFAAMVRSDLGADVLRVQRAGATGPLSGGKAADVEGRSAVDVDLKDVRDVDLVKRLVGRADAIMEGFRPGVMERLGLCPDVLLGINPRLVYGRMTGYGQDGPLANVPGHDINYIAIAGALGNIRRAGERPLFPMNLLGDYGGGAMFLVVGLLAALLEVRQSGKGQVVDVAMTDGVSVLSTIFHGMRRDGLLREPPGSNALDSGAHFYEVYETADGRHMAVGAIEPRFYADLLARLEIAPDDMPQWDSARWPDFKRHLAGVFMTRTREEWTAVFEMSDACTTPVLTLAEAAAHHHNRARDTLGPDGIPLPAPRFSRTPGSKERPGGATSAEDALAAWGVSR